MPDRASARIPSISRHSPQPRRKGKGGSASSPQTKRCGMFCSHPNGMRFRAQGTVEWPWDRFTQRRLRDGSIRVVEQADTRKAAAPAEKPKEDKKDEKKEDKNNKREAAAAREPSAPA